MNDWIDIKEREPETKVTFSTMLEQEEKSELVLVKGINQHDNAFEEKAELVNFCNWQGKWRTGWWYPSKKYYGVYENITHWKPINNEE